MTVPKRNTKVIQLSFMCKAKSVKSCVPSAKKCNLVKNGYRTRDFIGLPIGGKKVIIRMKVQRYKCTCPDCDYDQQEKIPFATGSRSYTHRFAKYVVDFCCVP